MIEITMVSGAKYFMPKEKNTQRSNVGVMDAIIAGSTNPSIEVFSDEGFTSKVFISSLKIESYRIIV